MNSHHRLDGMVEFLIGVLAGHDAGQDRGDDGTDQTDEAEGREQKREDPERKGDGVEYHDGDDEATRGGDDAIFRAVVGRSHRNSRGGGYRCGGDGLLGSGLVFTHACCWLIR